MVGVMLISHVAKSVHLRHYNRHMLKRSCAMSITKSYAGMPKKATNVSLAETLLAEAKALQINVSQAAEFGVANAVAQKRAALWIAQNREAIESSNAYVEKHGLPLESVRMF